MDSYSYIGKILSVSQELLFSLEKEMGERTGRKNVLKIITEENKQAIENIKSYLGCEEDNIGKVLEHEVLLREKNIRAYMEKNILGENEFEKVVKLARKIGPQQKGFFLKRDRAEKILIKRKPEKLLEFLRLKTIGELFKRYDVAEAFSALRFIESDEWMHTTFDKAYSEFTEDDFEERNIEIKVLGPEWLEVVKKFVAKKHHNVSHLKEFGVIFLNPIQENIPGKFLRDFALLLHYFNEIGFYSKLFKKYAPYIDFAEKLKSLLRGDVQQKNSVKDGEWLIIQRYLWKENPNDSRLFLPRVNPESLHWARAEENLVEFGKNIPSLGISMWEDHDWVAEYTKNVVVSYGLEDNAMSAVSSAEGKSERFFYHQREALWTKIFQEYAGGRELMEKKLVEHFMDGAVQF